VARKNNEVGRVWNENEVDVFYSPRSFGSLEDDKGCVACGNGMIIR
jgi:hypothetical protein